MRTLLVLLLLTSVCYANSVCTTDKDSGDRTCVDGNVTYVYPSKATLDAREAIQKQEAADEAQAKADAQAVADLKQQQQDLRNQAVDAILNGEDTTDIKAQLDTTTTAISAKSMPIKKVAQ